MDGAPTWSPPDRVAASTRTFSIWSAAPSIFTRQSSIPSLDPKIALDVLPELHRHAVVDEDPLIIRIVHLVLRVGTLVVGALLLVGLERREVLVLPDQDVPSRLLARNVLVEVADALPLLEELSVVPNPREPLAHGLLVLFFFPLDHEPALDFEDGHGHYLPSTRRRFPSSLPYFARRRLRRSRSGSDGPARAGFAASAAAAASAFERKRLREGRFERSSMVSSVRIVYAACRPQEKQEKGGDDILRYSSPRASSSAFSSPFSAPSSVSSY